MSYRICWISVLAFFVAAGCSREPGDRLDVYHAGSLSMPFERLEAAFEAAHAGVDVRRYVYGSVMAIRQITDIGKEADILASADYQLIDDMMIKNARKWASWNLLFAKNSMCIAYGDGCAPLTAGDWDSTLTTPDAKVGISNPNQDPCGYRSLLAVYLAQERLGKAGLFDDIIVKNSGVTSERAGARTILNVPSALNVRGGLVVRPKETDLIALFQTGAIDYLFIYRSVAVQHNMKFVELPAGANLSEPSLADVYGAVSVRLNADKPNRSTTVRGSAVVYGITVPSTVRRPELAKEFIRLLLSEEGRKIMHSCGQEPVWPPRYSNASLKKDLPF